MTDLQPYAKTTLELFKDIDFSGLNEVIENIGKYSDQRVAKNRYFPYIACERLRL